MKFWLAPVWAVALFPVIVLDAVAGVDLPLPAPPYPAVALAAREHGSVFLHVLFDDSGKVKSVSIVKTTAPKDLGDYTISFVTAKWYAPEFANREVDVPIGYDLPNKPETASSGISNPPYPYYAALYHEQGVVNVHVVWDHAGHVKECTIKSSTAGTYLDHYTTDYITRNWNGPALADKANDVPIVFKLQK